MNNYSCCVAKERSTFATTKRTTCKNNSSHMTEKNWLVIIVLLFATQAWAGERFNFNANWKVQMGENPQASGMKCDDSQWQTVTLPWSFNQQEAYGKHIAQLTDTVAWYRKHFTLPAELKKGKKL